MIIRHATAPATLEDFEEVLERRCREAVDIAGRASATIFSEAAAQNALGNSRLGLILMDSLERVWRELLDQVSRDLRQWAERTTLEHIQLRSTAEQRLRNVLPLLTKQSHVDRSGSGFPGNEMLPSVAERIAELPDDVAFMLRQFEIGMDAGSHDPRSELPRKAKIDWQMWGAVVGVMSLILAALALIAG